MRKFLLIFIAGLVLPYTLFSQDLSREISVKFKKSAIKDVILKLGEVAGLQFSYSSQLIPLDKEITYKANSRQVSAVLNDVFTLNGINFAIVENQVVLTPAKDSELKPRNSRSFTISGLVRDKKTGELLIGASVWPDEIPKGAVTNAFGFFSLTLPEGKYSVNISFLGYEKITIHLNLDKDLFLKQELDYNILEIETVEVTYSDSSGTFNNLPLGEVQMREKDFGRLTGLSGTCDIIKSLQSVPGITLSGDGSSFFNVRGGNSDQNLILIDDAPIYNPSHLFGFFTAPLPGSIKEINVYKGDFPAGFGGRLSSVIDIRTKDGNMNNLSFTGNINPFVSDLLFEGPLKKAKHSFLLSLRKSNLAWLNYMRPENSSLKILFFDINSKFNFRLSDYDRLYITFYTGYDEFGRMISSKIRNFGMSWNNILGTVRWNHIYNSKLFSNTTLYFSDYNYYLYFTSNPYDYWNSSVMNYGIKSDFTYFLSPQNTVKGGFEIASEYFNPGNLKLSEESGFQSLPSVSEYRTSEFTLYLSNILIPIRKLTLRCGIRVPVRLNTGPSTIYTFNTLHNVIDTLYVNKNSEYSRFIKFEPRVNISYNVTGSNIIVACYNRVNQFEQIISNSTSPFNSLEVLIPSGPNILPQQSDQFSLGYSGLAVSKRFQFSTDVFYRKYINQVDYEEHPNLLFNPLIEGELRFGEAESYGAELTLKKNSGKFNGWANYTYSRVLKKTEEINKGNVYPATYDRPHNFNMNLAYRINNRLNLTANWQYITGQAITTPTGFFYYNGYSIPLYNTKNNDRLPDYHRLDFSAEYRLNKNEKKYSHSLNFTLYNVYGRENPISVNFNKIADDNGNFVVPTDLNGNYERIPTSISLLGIVPSVTYKFRFL